MLLVRARVSGLLSSRRQADPVRCSCGAAILRGLQGVLSAAAAPKDMII